MARRIDGSESLGVDTSTLPLLGESYSVQSKVGGPARLLGREGLEVEQLRGRSGIFLTTRGRRGIIRKTGY